MGRVLVVGTPVDREVLAELLALHGYEVSQSPIAALAATARACNPEVVIADLRTPDLEGPRFAAAIAGLSPRPRAIALTSCSCRALAASGVECLVKPVKLDRLLRALAASRPEIAA
jgi:CheY-like chemotaxis protein